MASLQPIQPVRRRPIRLPAPWPACAQGLLRSGAHWLHAGQGGGWDSDILALPGGSTLEARWMEGVWRVFDDGIAVPGMPYEVLERVASGSSEPFTGAISFEVACAEAGLPCSEPTAGSLGMSWRAAPAWIVHGTEGTELWNWSGDQDSTSIEARIGAACDLGRPEAGALSPRWTRERHREEVEAIRARIHDGGFYVANLCVPFDAALDGDPLTFALSALKRNRPPFGAWMDLQDLQLLCLSMERALSLEAGRLLSEPIKGTLPRTGDRFADAAAAAKLRADPKERAEHTMILDLVRNDLGRVARTGTVRVAETMAIRPFETVQHMVSSVEATLRPGVGLAAILRAALPGGSVTGAPKHAVCGHLSRVEAAPRGFYCGALGWIAPGGQAFDLAMPIRTATIRSTSLEYWAGGGITRLSRPDLEWEELWLKAKALG